MNALQSVCGLAVASAPSITFACNVDVCIEPYASLKGVELIKELLKVGYTLAQAGSASRDRWRSTKRYCTVYTDAQAVAKR